MCVGLPLPLCAENANNQIPRAESLPNSSIEQSFNALKMYLEVQRQFPDNKEAPKAIVNLLLTLGLPHMAFQEAIAKNVPLSPAEQASLMQNLAVRELRWADTYDHDPEKRFYYIDKATEDLLTTRNFAVLNQLDLSRIQSLDFDLIVAYDQGNRYKDAIELYQSLDHEHVEFPMYVRLAIANSLAKNHQYADAARFYVDYLKHDPDNFNAKMGYFYALIDQDKFDDADILIKGMSDDLRAQLLSAQKRAYVPGENRDFVRTLRERYTNTQIAAASALSYRDQLDAANLGIDRILNEAPASTDALVTKGNIELWMGNPRQALEYFQIARGASPENVDARVGRANASFDMHDYKAFNEQVGNLLSEYPDLQRVKDLETKRVIYQSPLLTGDFALANGKSSARDLNSATADVRVYSNPIDDNYRVYARFRGLYSGPAVQSDVSAGAIGLKYAGPGHEIALEGGDRGYAKLEGTKFLNDSWSGSLSFERNGFYLFPGALYPIYTGNVAGGAINWKNNDTQKAVVGYQYWRLSNNNQTQMFANFVQRLLTDYNYRLEGSLWIGNQQNSNPNVGYFAPWNQTEYSGTASFEFLQWRDQESKKYSFWHKIWGTYGVVTQQGFATLAMNSVGYGQNFTLGDQQRLAWGVGRTYFPFDGAQSSYLTGYLRFERSF